MVLLKMAYNITVFYTLYWLSAHLMGPQEGTALALTGVVIGQFMIPDCTETKKPEGPPAADAHWTPEYREWIKRYPPRLSVAASPAPDRQSDTNLKSC